MPKLFEIVSQGPYSIELKEIKNIEDAGDQFVTEEELDEMGVTSKWDGVKLFEEKIKAAVQHFVSEIKQGQKSIIITDQDLIDVLSKNDRAVSEYVPNTRRVVNRLFKHESKEKTKSEVTYSDWSDLMNMFCSILNQVHGIDLSMRLTYCKNREQAVTLFKKMISWTEIEEYIKSSNQRSQPSEHEQLWMKKVYENPSLVPKVKEKDDPQI